MTATLRVFTSESGRDGVPNTMLRQQFSVGRIYLDFFYDSSARVLMGETPSQTMEVILLELIPFHFPSVERYSGALGLAAESVPLWSANIQHARLIDDSQASERVGFHVLPNSFKCFPPHNQRIRIDIQNILKPGIDHPAPQFDARVRCYMGGDRYQRIASVNLSDPALDTSRKASILIPNPIFDVILGPNLIFSVRAFKDQLRSEDTLPKLPVERGQKTFPDS